MYFFTFFQKFLIRLRYPVSLPEEVAEAFGISLSNHLVFKDFVQSLVKKPCELTKLTKFMPRLQAEKAFLNAVKTEKFINKTLISYYFNEGWLEFILHFDNESRLRRVYMLHGQISSDQGIEIPLIKKEPISC